HLFAGTLCEQSSHHSLEILLRGTAEAAVRKHRDVAFASFDEDLIERHIAELVDDDCSPGHFGMAQQPVQQRGLPAPQKPRDQGNRETALALRRQEKRHGIAGGRWVERRAGPPVSRFLKDGNGFNFNQRTWPRKLWDADGGTHRRLFELQDLVASSPKDTDVCLNIYQVNI